MATCGPRSEAEELRLEGSLLLLEAQDASHASHVQPFGCELGYPLPADEAGVRLVLLLGVVPGSC